MGQQPRKKDVPRMLTYVYAYSGGGWRHGAAKGEEVYVEIR